MVGFPDFKVEGCCGSSHRNVIEYSEVDCDSCDEGFSRYYISNCGDPFWPGLADNLVQGGHRLCRSPWKESSERFLESREVGEVWSKLNHLVSLGWRVDVDDCWAAADEDVDDE